MDERGGVVRGDQIGVLGGLALQADSVTTPVSSNTALEKTGRFWDIRRTRIGSPFVIDAMNEALQAGKQRVVGYEANGGFLLGSDFGTLKALPTRDSVLPVLLVLVEAARRRKSVSALVAELPARYTASDLIRNFALERSQAVLAELERGGLPLLTAAFSAELGAADDIDTTDGVRVTFHSGDILHFRPSGNAPEFRIYSESSTEERAIAINALGRKWVEKG
jgi:phosphomannomutase